MSDYSTKRQTIPFKQSIYEQQQHRRNKTQDIQLHQEQYQQYIPPKSKKRKFVQHSIFLPVIKNKQSMQNSQRLKSRSRIRNRQISSFENYQDEDFKQSNSQSQTTMEYINQCERIIQNLKKLTSVSTNRIPRKKNKLQSRNQRSNQRNIQNIYEDQQLSLMINRRDANKNKNSYSRIKSSSLKQQPRVKTSANQYSNNPQNHFQNHKSKNSNEKNNQQMKKQQTQRLKQDKQLKQLELKAQQQLKKAQRKQNILIKFLGKARNRGFQLQKKITQFRMKKKLQQNEQSKLNTQRNNKEKQQADKSTLNSQNKTTNLKKDQNLSPKKLPQIKTDNKQKKSK